MKLSNCAERAAKRYLREVRRNLPCSFKIKRELLSRLQEALADFVEEHPQASYEDITERFGVPTDVADAYFADMPADKLRRVLQTARFARRVVAIACFLAILLYGIAVGYVVYNSTRTQVDCFEATVDQGQIDRVIIE